MDTLNKSSLLEQLRPALQARSSDIIPGMEDKAQTLLKIIQAMPSSN